MKTEACQLISIRTSNSFFFIHLNHYRLQNPNYIDMTIEEFELASKGAKLHCQAWLPEQEPQVIICLIHGLSEHIGRYEEFAEFFTSQQIAVFAYDLRGHGKSPGKRGHVRQYDLLLEDVENTLKIARREYNNALLILFGQSFGGNIVSNYLVKKNTSEVAGAILSAPWLKLAFDPPPFKVKLASIMKNIYPAYSENSKINSGMLSKDEEKIKAYLSDPLVHNKISAGLFFSIIKQGEAALENAFKVTIPLLVIHGKEDKLTSWKASEEFVTTVGDRGTFRLYDGVMHEPHNDPEREMVLNEVQKWISNNVNK